MHRDIVGTNQHAAVSILVYVYVIKIKCFLYSYVYACVQTARLLFRMSLIHLPVYMLCAVIHRIPNTAPVTWEQAIKYFQQGAEDAEQRLHSQVHSDEGNERYFGPMVFIFSPPLLVPPCPYTAIKKSLSVATAEAEHPQIAPTIDHSQEGYASRKPERSRDSR